MKKPKFNRQFKSKDLAVQKTEDDVVNVDPSASVESAGKDSDSRQAGAPLPTPRLPKLKPLMVMDGDKEKEIHLPQLFKRHGWHHGVRWVAFIGIMLLDVLLVLAGIQTHLLSPKAATMQAIGKELLGYALVFTANFGVLPSIVLEANKVECTDDKLILNNLLFKSEIPWSEIRAISNPIFLKFAIVKTAKFFYLLNKRDLERFYELLQILQAKTGLPSK